jgi:hypothetical protein
VGRNGVGDRGVAGRIAGSVVGSEVVGSSAASATYVAFASRLGTPSLTRATPSLVGTVPGTPVVEKVAFAFSSSTSSHRLSSGSRARGTTWGDLLERLLICFLVVVLLWYWAVIKLLIFCVLLVLRMVRHGLRGRHM